MKWNQPKLVITACIISALLILTQYSYATPNSQTHTLDTKGSDGCYFQLDNSCGLWFDAEYIYFGDSNGLWKWIDNDEMRFYNLKMGASECPSPWNIKISGPANVTVSTLFELDKFEAVVSAESGVTSTVSFYCGSKGEPSLIKVDGKHVGFSYDDDSATATVSVTCSSSHSVEVLWSKALTGFQTFLLILYGILPLLVLVVVALIGGGVVLAVRSLRRDET